MHGFFKPRAASDRVDAASVDPLAYVAPPQSSPPAAPPPPRAPARPATVRPSLPVMDDGDDAGYDPDDGADGDSNSVLDQLLATLPAAARARPSAGMRPAALSLAPTGPPLQDRFNGAMGALFGAQGTPEPVPLRAPAPYVPASRDRWHSDAYAYAVLAAIGYTVWILDGVSTVLGALLSILPQSLLGMVAALAIHMFLSWGQRTFLRSPVPLVKGIGIVLLCINAYANIFGLWLTITVWQPDLLSGLPSNLGAWGAGIWAWMTGGDAPTWLPHAVTLTLVSFALAWWSEMIRDYTRGLFVGIWQQRPTRLRR